MGIMIFDWETHIKQVLHEHRGNRQVYLNITDEHQTRMQDLSKRFKQFCDKHADTLGKNTVTFFCRSQEAHGDNIARFRATAKVQKTPIKLRPIVAKAGTAIESLSKWLDVMLQKVMKQLPWCIKNSDTFITEILQIKIPPNARLVTFDAISMYSNIDLNHARTVMKHWLESYVPENIRAFNLKCNLLICAGTEKRTKDTLHFDEGQFLSMGIIRIGMISSVGLF